MEELPTPMILNIALSLDKLLNGVQIISRDVSNVDQ